jgi:hypothetical protein
MTTIGKLMVNCCLCGSGEAFKCVKSTNECGLPDLDTRPPEMLRSTIFTWVQQCPECGYCATDISEAPTQGETVIYSSEYIQQLNDETYPDLANSFLCKALIDKASGDYAEAVWAVIHAAWACDDAKKAEAARKCRIKAADLITKATSAGQAVSDEDGEATAIQVDLLRRAGRITEARKILAENRGSISDETFSKILDFQDDLLKRGDVACHTIEEAVGEGE